MTYEELDVFTKYDTDTGCIPNLQLKVKLANETLVQKRHNPISKPLHRIGAETPWPQTDTKVNLNILFTRRLCPGKKDKSLCPSVDFRV